MHRLEARSIRVGEIRLEDIQAQTEPARGRVLEVLALSAHRIPVTIPLGFAEKWGARSWQLQLACPRCASPCRRLRDSGDGFCCTRCHPCLSQQQRLKNTKFWSTAGRTTAAVVRAVTDGRHRADSVLAPLTTHLVRDLMDGADAVVPLALAALEFTDAIASESEHRPMTSNQRMQSSPRMETE